jgi:hypothetical protein
VISVLRAFGRFWWDFIVGDDWKVAVGVAFALAVGALVAASATTGATWIAPVVGGGLLFLFALVVVADVRR